MRKAIFCLLLLVLAVICLSLSAFSQPTDLAAASSTYRGDINEDGKVDVFDLLELLKSLAGQNQTERKRQIADVNASGAADIFDLLGILKLLSGMEKPGVIYWGPVITGLSLTSAAIGDTLEIHVENFEDNITAADVKAFAGQSEISLLDYTSGKVRVVIPNGFTGAEIKLIVASKDTTNAIFCNYQARLIVQAAAGGTVEHAGGTASVQIPAGALQSNAAITVEVPTSAELADMGVPADTSTTIVSFGPTGTYFAQPVTIAVPWPDDATHGDSLDVKYYDETDQVWKTVEVHSVDPSKRLIYALTDHFTAFKSGVKSDFRFTGNIYKNGGDLLVDFKTSIPWDSTRIAERFVFSTQGLGISLGDPQLGFRDGQNVKNYLRWWVGAKTSPSGNVYGPGQNKWMEFRYDIKVKDHDFLKRDNLLADTTIVYRISHGKSSESNSFSVKVIDGQGREIMSSIPGQYVNLDEVMNIISGASVRPVFKGGYLPGQEYYVELYLWVISYNGAPFNDAPYTNKPYNPYDHSRTYKERLEVCQFEEVLAGAPWNGNTKGTFGYPAWVSSDAVTDYAVFKDDEDRDGILDADYNRPPSVSITPLYGLKSGSVKVDFKLTPQGKYTGSNMSYSLELRYKVLDSIKVASVDSIKPGVIKDSKISGLSFGDATLFWNSVKDLAGQKGNSADSMHIGLAVFVDGAEKSVIWSNPFSVDNSAKAVVQPDSLDFGIVSLRRDSTMSITIKNAGAGLLQILGTDFSDTAFTRVSGISNLNPGGIAKIEIKFSPKGIRKYQEWLTIRTNDPTGNKMVKLKGIGYADPEIEDYAIEKKYPEIFVGDTIIAKYKVNNPNPDPVSVSLVLRYRTSAGVYGKFESVDTLCSIEPGIQWYNKNVIIPATLKPGKLDVSWDMLRPDSSKIDTTGYIKEQIIISAQSLSGRIVECSWGLSRVNVQVIGVDFDTLIITSSDGYFKVPGIKNGSYQIIPSREGFSFSPEMLRVNIKGHAVGNELETTIFAEDISHGVEMVCIPGGSFTMGSDEFTYLGISDRRQKAHSVTLTGFLMGKYEITIDQYTKYLNEALLAKEISVDSTYMSTYRMMIHGVKGKSIHAGLELIWLDEPLRWSIWEHWQIKYQNGRFVANPLLGDFPVGLVSWYGADAFAQHYGLTLPTEAEWEYACRAGSATKYFWGDSWDDRYFVYFNNSTGTGFIKDQRYGGHGPKKVGSMLPNKWGLYDMIGNMLEWCYDWSDFAISNYSYYENSPSINPMGPSDPNGIKVVRGKSQYMTDPYWDTYWAFYVCSRNCGEIQDMNADQGFRVARRGDTAPYVAPVTPPPSVSTYGLQGSVLESGSGLAGVSVRVTGNGVDNTITTGSGGTYSLSGLENGTYTITPSLSGYTFSPENLQVVISGSDVSVGSITATASGGSVTPRDTTVVFVPIPGGSFQMGQPGVAEPVHQVTVSAFQMSAKEITNSQYAAYLNTALVAGEITATARSVTGAKGDYSGQMYIDLSGRFDLNNRCWISYNGTRFSVAAGKENWPVIFVTWYGAKAFAVKYGFDLPREGEWEYASRGGNGYEYGTVDGSISSAKANYNSSVGFPKDVGSYPANPFGLYDLAGNVWEWCNDFYGSYSNVSQTDPVGPSSGSDRVMRGGSWYDSASCRSAYRDYRNPNLNFAFDLIVGFRVVRRGAFGNTLQGSILESGSGLSGVSVRIMGNGVDNTITTGSGGTYSLSGLENGTYTINPSLSGYTFSPESRTVTVNGANVNVSSFTATASGGSVTPRDTTVDKGITFVSIPGGTFQMGQTSVATPVHQVTVSAFQMSTKEITNSQYAAYLNAALVAGEITVNSSSVKGAKGDYSGMMYIELSSIYYNAHYSISYNGSSFSVATGKENWPVGFVTWYGAKAFAVKYGFDLPHEGEWEYAARGGKSYEYGTDDGTISSIKAYYNDFQSDSPKDVGSYPANPFGLYDLAGNSWEWCNDWYGSYNSASQTDPIGPSSASYRVLRGGSWVNSNSDCRSASRNNYYPENTSSNFGFRVVRR